jgi:hypothetical protein
MPSRARSRPSSKRRSQRSQNESITPCRRRTSPLATGAGIRTVWIVTPCAVRFLRLVGSSLAVDESSFEPFVIAVALPSGARPVNSRTPDRLHRDRGISETQPTGCPDLDGPRVVAGLGSIKTKAPQSSRPKIPRLN